MRAAMLEVSTHFGQGAGTRNLGHDLPKISKEVKPSYLQHLDREVDLCQTCSGGG